MKTLKDINWNQVYCFYEVARKLSMKEASQILGVSIPTVSEQIRRLEKVFDTQLFRRLPRKIEFTDEGHRLYLIAKEMFEVGGKFLDTVSLDMIGGYPVRVGIQESLLDSVASDFLNQYWDLFAPFGTVNTKRIAYFDNLMEQLLQGQCDFTIACKAPKINRLKYRAIGTVEMVFCCASQIYQRFQFKEDILKVMPLAKSTWDTTLNEMVDDNLKRIDIIPDEFIESDHQDFVMDLILRGRCVGIFPRSLVQSNKFKDQIHVLDVGEPITMSLYAIWLQGSERMIAIKKLFELLDLKSPPAVMADPTFQVKLGNFSPETIDLT